MPPKSWARKSAPRIPASPDLLTQTRNHTPPKVLESPRSSETMMRLQHADSSPFGGAYWEPSDVNLPDNSSANDDWGTPALQADEPWDVTAGTEEESGDDWAEMPELPTVEELSSAVYDKAPLLKSHHHNRLEGPWDSKAQYLRTHYKLLREDAIRPLREAVKHVRAMKDIKEDPRHATIGIYDGVRIVGVTFSPRGLAVRIVFSLKCVGKSILWKQSKRLLSGSLVLLMAKNDHNTLKVATIAARPLAGLEQNPPEIDLFFATPSDLELDPAREWIMVAERSGYYEAERHTLVALQKMSRERFPLSEYLVHLQPDIKNPPYLQKSYEDLDATFPSMDASQVKATRRILTKSLAIVQGPPGTGKTYVSVQALQLMLANHTPGDPPIVITCMTNHALDQILRHVYEFQPELVRLGGRSKDLIIKKRTLFEVREANPKLAGNARRSAHIAIKALTKSILALMEPLKKDGDPVGHETLHKLQILTDAQCDSLEKGNEGWVRHSEGATPQTPISMWLGKQLVKVKPRAAPLIFDFEVEELELGFEEVKEQDAEAVLGDDDDNLEALTGAFINIGDSWTGSGAEGTAKTAIENLLRQHKDLSKIPPSQRGALYRHLLKQAKDAIVKEVRKEAVSYARAVNARKHGNWEADVALLKSMKVIGMTTTGFSKYRGLVIKLAPKIVLIEEAGESLEAPVIATCIESLEQLILVGDHKQLRPHCHVSELEGPPWNMNVSLFERLVMNDMDFSLLQRQRRMIPRIRRLLTPIYGDVITDHPAVLDKENRPPVPGMTKNSTWFWTHTYPEDKDDQMSSYNIQEAEMIAGMVVYLILNGVQAKEITILTFYNGQRRKINQILRNNPNLAGKLIGLQTPTVDSYQGEENAFVLLSLVRSNPHGKIGFLSVDNRVCVALSRAQRGFYMFGNAELLACESKTWAAVVKILFGAVPDEHGKQSPCRIGYSLPLYCVKHKRRSWVSGPEEWQDNVGGCDVPCREKLPCAHTCPLRCHPFSHDNYICRAKCTRLLPCGHACATYCGDMPCVCTRCVPTTKPKRLLEISARSGGREPSPSGSSEWNEYSRGGAGAARDDEAAVRALGDEGERLRLLRLDAENGEMLFGTPGGGDEDDADLALGALGGVLTSSSSSSAAAQAGGRVLVSTQDGGRKTVWRHGATVGDAAVLGAKKERVQERSLLDD